MGRLTRDSYRYLDGSRIRLGGMAMDGEGIDPEILDVACCREVMAAAAKRDGLPRSSRSGHAAGVSRAVSLAMALFEGFTPLVSTELI
jgi:hypothetical protein